MLFRVVRTITAGRPNENYREKQAALIGDKRNVYFYDTLNEKHESWGTVSTACLQHSCCSTVDVGAASVWA
jgi:hypothetical protein